MCKSRNEREQVQVRPLRWSRGWSSQPGGFGQKRRSRRRFLIKFFQTLKAITDKTESDSSETKRLEDGYRSWNRGKFSWSRKEKFFLLGTGPQPLGILRALWGKSPINLIQVDIKALSVAAEAHTFVVC